MNEMTDPRRTRLVGVLLCCVIAAPVGAQDAGRPSAPARAQGRSLAERYPLAYPPKLAGGGTSAVEETADFLRPGPNLRDGVAIASTPPRVEFSFYPEQNYPGNPWSHRSDGFVRGDKYYSSSNDHLAPRGTALLWEYNAATRAFRQLCNTTKFLESVHAFPASMNYRPGEMQSRIDLGRDGWLYYATDRGSPTVTNDAHGYLGEWILRTHPQTLQTEIVATHPIAKHTIPASVLDPERMILYCGTAPGKDSPQQSVQFFALDLKSRKLLKVADNGPTRTLILSPSTGRVFWEGKVYDPRTNEIQPANVPHVRSCTRETPQGLVYGTSGTTAGLWSLDVKTGEVRQLGTAAVASQEYIASIEADPTGRYLYYVPGAHGGATKDGTPIVQYDTQTGQRKVLAFLHETFWNKHGYALDGSFGNALDEKGERFFISWDGWRKGQPRGWESASITVLHIPATERKVADLLRKSAVAEKARPLLARADEDSDAPPAAVNSRSELSTLFERKVVDLLRKSTVAEKVRPLLARADEDSDAPPAAVNSRSELTTLFEQSVTKNLQLSKDGRALELCSGVLIEDDGPAAGYSYLPNEELLSEPVHIKKELIVDRPHASKATLLIGRPGRMQPPLDVKINGRAAKLEPAGRAGRYWEAYTFDPKLLVAGKNEFVLHGGGKIWIAREEDFAAGSRERRHHPNRSAKSVDGGRTWDYEHLGTRNDLDGEYYVRLFLDQPVAKGSLVSRVVDVGNLDGQLIGRPIAEVGPPRVLLQSSQPESVKLRYRTSKDPDPKATGWSAWGELPAAGGKIESPSGRYLQLCLELVAGADGSAPRVQNLSIEATPKRAADWTSQLQSVAGHNEQIVRTSIPFEYEPLNQPRLKQLREQYKLDDVVQDASNEFEQICRLAAWSSQRWDKMHLAQSYPAWNALEILSPHADGKPIGGFCQQYNLVFLQACESFGLSGRAVSIDQGASPRQIAISGHEVVEIWSNDYKKWIYVDGNCAWYAVDLASGTPLSLLELRERQIATLNGEKTKPIRIIKLAETRHKWEGLTSWPAFVELRLIPRSNFLQQKAPLPLNQGMSGWFWTGHHVWEDELAPTTLLYGHRERKESNFAWTLNQAHYTLEALSEPGQIRVHLETVTPGFETFVAKIDDAAAQPVQSGFLWKLHSGKNRLEVRPRNLAGRDGIASWIELQWQ